MRFDGQDTTAYLPPPLLGEANEQVGARPMQA
jgi:hypothetical protein